MPTLNWIGKEAVVNHDKEVPFKLLKKVKSLSIGKNSKNLIIHGDNLEALKALMPYYTNKIKCIYIDPPYNTGNEKWVYNDKVNSPKIKKWLGKVVGGESEDLCRHDKWLCMIYPRLKLLKNLLTNDGVIFISIGEDEINNLKNIMNELFGENNFITIISRVAKKGSSMGKFFSPAVDYILIYSKNKELCKGFKEPLSEEYKSKYKLRDDYGGFVIKGLYQSSLDPLRGCNNQRYFIKCPDGSLVIPPGNIFPKEKKDGSKIAPKTKEDKVWRWARDSYLDKKKFLYFKKTKTSPLVDEKGKQSKWNIYTRQYLRDIKEKGYVPGNYLDRFTNIFGTKSIKDVKLFFNFPKPPQLIQYLIQLMQCEKDDIVLDSFAGSGTTGEAVLEINKKSKNLNLKFILVEMEDEVSEKVTAERIKRIIKKNKYYEGFEFCELDKPLFDQKGQIDQSCSFNQLATYIYFTETQTNLSKKSSGDLIGIYNEIEYYLIFKEKNKNILDKSFLKKLPKNQNQKIIYADKCLIDEETLEKKNIQFKQIPYEVKIY